MTEARETEDIEGMPLLPSQVSLRIIGVKKPLLVEVSCSRMLLAAPELLALHLELFLIFKAFLDSSGGEAISVNSGMCFYEALSG